MSDSYYNGQPDDETRQHYVTTRIQEFQRVCFETGRPVPWDVLRYSFIGYGIQYDQGYRLRHFQDVAA